MTGGGGKEGKKEGIQEMAKSKLRKKSQSAPATASPVRRRPSVRSLPFLLLLLRRSIGRSSLLGNSFSIVQIPRLSVLEFFQVEEEKEVDISAVPLSLSLSLSRH